MNLDMPNASSNLNICCIDLFREHAPRLCMSCKEELKALGVISGSEHSFQ